MPLTGVTSISNDALGWILDLAHDDQLHYVKFGSPQTDYGDEWPAVAKQRAAWCREIAASASIAGEDERWSNLAALYDASVEPEVWDEPSMPILKCTGCGDDLEVGQSGRCDDCRQDAFDGVSTPEVQ